MQNVIQFCLNYEVMRKIILSVIFSIFSLAIFAEPASADFLVAESSARLRPVESIEQIDSREIALRKFLESHNSPLAPYAKHFIQMADVYNIDWRFVPAVAGVESTFGKRMPKNSYNAYGWVNGAYKFGSWEDSIEVVSKTIREKYINKGATSLDKIARRYAPPSKTWAWKVRYFMIKIEPLPVRFATEG